MKIPKAIKDQVAQLLAAGWGNTKIAEKVGIGRRTISRWLAEDEKFRSQVEELRNENLEQLKSLLSQAAPAAVSVLTDVMMGRVPRVPEGELGEEDELGLGPKEGVRIGERIRAADRLLAHLGNWIASTDVVIFADKVGKALDQALKGVSPQMAERIRTVLAHGLIKAGVSADGVSPATRKRGKHRCPASREGDNTNTGSGAG